MWTTRSSRLTWANFWATMSSPPHTHRAAPTAFTICMEFHCTAGPNPQGITSPTASIPINENGTALTTRKWERSPIVRCKTLTPTFCFISCANKCFQNESCLILLLLLLLFQFTDTTLLLFYFWLFIIIIIPLKFMNMVQKWIISESGIY